MFSMKKEALAAQAGQLLLDQLPVDAAKLKKAAKYMEPKNIKRIAIAAVGGSALLSLVGSLGHDRLYRAAVARELKKQLEPIQKQLDELAEQNEALIRQNEALQEQLSRA
ncbi:MAG: hypothetical protein K6F56_04675 [Oscillospiraceae bacterium]|nr:hypothetical protein [Oscillospiraceae bacterium]